MSEILSCFDPAANPGKMLPVAESITHILEQISVKTETKIIPITEAVDCILAQEIISTINVPQQTNSAMDGYAVCAESVAENMEIEIIGTVYAGGNFDSTVHQGQAVEIMTGAPLPKGADSIIIKEACTVKEQTLSYTGHLEIGQHVRLAGEDIAQGDTVLSAGQLLRPQELGLLASLGYSEVEVFAPVRVAIFSTGDEVTAQGQPLPQNCIYDTNRYTLHGLLKRLGCNVVDLGIIEDSEAAMIEALKEAERRADIVISSGGVSMGNADYIKSALESVGEINFWRIAMRPGRPLAFGKLGDDTPFFGLPGNPVAVMVTFTQFVQPAIRKMAGEPNWQPKRVIATAEADIRSRINRTDYSRGVFTINSDGETVVRTTGSQGSGILTSMSKANCFIEIGDDIASVKAGDRVIIQPFADHI
ncbi:bifunctional molybdopterin-guanine dinucleotide biosynthesis adaptor protein MobB/molybdopterin molybdotransferase MoeA [Neptuniibacter caesariensis]|uniref:Molybdopterin molybdenumtransferase n=1 Tax=Neptuniibacter caesariensis TaxID=207954 RepID=A0A7U8GT96_NEPCE|nr:bifunctional molybdopterin-guanine dinucleotide biosynthesis adaptor protein MobB/molybdopterin molybdotransferase MoeA [Neptuniibacter caesariensis]EAR62062.1 molybdopterin biosynthesis MoeA protein [Oceanospirillum sp. MED92] [Neptuniibacter caesariensis]